jgi:type IV fimbrial biogenesis protein FimT
MSRQAHLGFTLIELMMGLAIAAILLVLAVPNYTIWIADNQIRSGAESIAGGLRYAQAEAIRENVALEFVLDPTTGTGSWIVRPIGGATIQKGVFAEGAGNVIMTVVPAATTIATFSSLGVIQTNADGSGTLTQVKVTSPLAGSRNLNVLVGVAAGATGAGRIKVCDPKWPANDPKGCPP